MGRNKAVALVVALLMVAGALFADYEVRGSDVFPVSRQIARIYAHRLGYKIVFQKDNSDFGVFYVPMEWFRTAGGKGEIVWGTSVSYPTFTAFYVDGKFDHIRLYLLKNLSDPTWDILSASEAEEKRFDIDTLDISF
jgi:hypothetical protein